VAEHKNPAPTVDIVIELDRGIVLIERKNPPYGWALPGGFVDEGEPLWQAAKREAREETSLEVELTEQFHAYSDPRRDARRHTISTVFLARASGTPLAADDARAVGVFREGALPPLVFDHAAILDDYFRYRRDGVRPGPER
jgi:ADP-ribose pyrophosphatase YjhB (NUDIX family)